MAKKAAAGEGGRGQGKVAMPRWSPLERQYRNRGSWPVVVLGGMTQNYFNKDLAMLLLRSSSSLCSFTRRGRSRGGAGATSRTSSRALKATEKEDAKKKD